MPKSMDDIFLPDETGPQGDEGDGETALRAGFKKHSIDGPEGSNHSQGSGPLHASQHVKITFDRFVTLVANHSFMDVVERNRDEEVILSTNLLTDLANARGISPKTRGPMLVTAGVVIGIFLAYFIF